MTSAPAPETEVIPVGGEFLAALIVVAVLAGGTKPGRAFIRASRRATGRRAPRAAMQHHSGRLGAATGRAIDGSSPRVRRSSTRMQRSAATGLWQTRRGPLIPLVWRAAPDHAAGSAGSAAPGPKGDGPSSAGAGTAPRGLDPAAEQHIKRQACDRMGNGLEPDDVTVGQDGSVTLNMRRKLPWAKPVTGALRWEPDGDGARLVDLRPAPEARPTYSYGRAGMRAAWKTDDVDDAHSRARYSSTGGNAWEVHEYPPGRGPGTLLATYQNGQLMPPGDGEPPAPRHCVACGNPEGGDWGPLAIYNEPVYGELGGRPRLIHESHFTDPADGFYGRPRKPAPAPGTTTEPGDQHMTRNPRQPPHVGVGSQWEDATRGIGSMAGTGHRRTNMTARYILNLEPPTTDGEFLESCMQLGDVLKSLAEQIGNWADGLGSLKLPQSVLNPLHQVSDGITDAASGASQAAKSFEDEFEDARDTAAAGMHFTGQDAA